MYNFYHLFTTYVANQKYFFLCNLYIVDFYGRTSKQRYFLLVSYFTDYDISDYVTFQYANYTDLTCELTSVQADMYILFPNILSILFNFVFSWFHKEKLIILNIFQWNNHLSNLLFIVIILICGKRRRPFKPRPGKYGLKKKLFWILLLRKKRFNTYSLYSDNYYNPS